MRSLHAAAMALGASALFVACASSPPPRTLLALPPTVNLATAGAQTQSPGTPLLVVRRLDIPEHLQSRRVRFRAEASTLGEWPDAVWAERIEVAMTREFVAALRPRLPGYLLCEASCAERLPALALAVELQPLDYLRATRRLQAHARVTLATTGADARPLGTTELNFDLPASADTPQAQAEAISELLRQLATAVAPLLPSAVR